MLFFRYFACASRLQSILNTYMVSFYDWHLADQQNTKWVDCRQNKGSRQWVLCSGSVSLAGNQISGSGSCAVGQSYWQVIRLYFRNCYKKYTFVIVVLKSVRIYSQTIVNEKRTDHNRQSSISMGLLHHSLWELPISDSNWLRTF